ncbi:MAG: hypothetical protein HKN20_01740 [Gemmatimonadetes bacterium]|nr:hypothetical protein [Gemmatimonadota bacterium]
MSARSRLFAIAFLCVGAFLTPGGARGEVTLTLADEFPERGTPVAILLSGCEPGTEYTIDVTYRPNSETSFDETVGTVVADAYLATIPWQPLDAGITEVRVLHGEEKLTSRNVAVRFDRVPFSGILVFLGAGVLLFGGAMTSMRRALET